MKVLVACEFSGIVRDAFIKAGHEAISCDLLPSERLGSHYQGDVRDLLSNNPRWDLMIAHPPCTYLAVSGNRWFVNNPERYRQMQKAFEFVMEIANAAIPRIAIENPVGRLSTLWRKPDQYIQPYYFGDPTRKKTGLWLKNLPLLKPTKVVEPKIVKIKNGNGTDSEWHVKTYNLHGEMRRKARSRTFSGIAKAMAQQWG